VLRQRVTHDLHGGDQELRHLGENRKCATGTFGDVAAPSLHSVAGRPRSRFTSAWPNSPAADRLTPPRNAGTSIGATEDLRNLPLHLRKNNLARLLARRPQGIFVSEFEQGDIGPDLFRKACEFGLKGMVSKRRDSAYRAGRSSNGIKVKNPASPAMKRAKDAVFMTTVRHQTRCVDRRFEERV
jgi:hypothetical protein